MVQPEVWATERYYEDTAKILAFAVEQIKEKEGVTVGQPIQVELKIVPGTKYAYWQKKKFIE